VVERVADWTVNDAGLEAVVCIAEGYRRGHEDFAEKSEG
jgi:hypothetical protein